MTVPAVNINPLVAAVDAACTAAGIPFGDTNKPVDVQPNKPYVVGFFDGGRVGDRTMLSRDGVTVWMVLHTYGFTPDSVRVGRRQMLSAVFGLTGQSFGGWQLHAPVHSMTLATERDDRVNPPLYWQSDDFTLRLTPSQ
jgi:hypothetical protein